MNKLISTFIFSISLTATSQNLKDQLCNKVWYTGSDLLKSGNLVFSVEKSIDKVMEVKFLDDGTLQWQTVQGFIFTCPYEVKRDLIHIYFTVNNHYSKKQTDQYYRVKELSNKDLEFMVVVTAEFK